MLDPHAEETLKWHEEQKAKAKRIRENMHILMYGDVRTDMDALMFRRLMHPLNPEGYLTDLTFNFINVAI
jgi:hypothetical protein